MLKENNESKFVQIKCVTKYDWTLALYTWSYSMCKYNTDRRQEFTRDVWKNVV